MKNGKSPTRRQKAEMQTYHLNVKNWLVVKNEPRKMMLIHRFTGRTKEIERK